MNMLATRQVASQSADGFIMRVLCSTRAADHMRPSAASGRKVNLRGLLKPHARMLRLPCCTT
jgi:hypothetical protein